MKEGGPLYQEEMDSPVLLELAIKNLEVVSRFETRIDVEIELAAGPVILRKISFYIADGAMDVVLFGRDILKTLGIDPLTQLEELRAAKELKGMAFPFESFTSKEEERTTEIDDEVPILTSCTR